MAAQKRGLAKGLGAAAEGLLGGDRDGVLLLAFGGQWEPPRVPC